MSTLQSAFFDPQPRISGKALKYMFKNIFKILSFKPLTFSYDNVQRSYSHVCFTVRVNTSRSFAKSPRNTLRFSIIYLLFLFNHKFILVRFDWSNPARTPCQMSCPRSAALTAALPPQSPPTHSHPRSSVSRRNSQVLSRRTSVSHFASSSRQKVSCYANTLYKQYVVRVKDKNVKHPER